MDDDYYYFTIEHSVLEDGIHIADVESLICLKSKAFVDLSTRKQNGEQVDSKNIQKHKKDVFRLAAMLAPADKIELPDTIKEDVKRFVELTLTEKPNADFFRSAGLQGIDADTILDQIKEIFLHD